MCILMKWPLLFVPQLNCIRTQNSALTCSRTPYYEQQSPVPVSNAIGFNYMEPVSGW